LPNSQIDVENVSVRGMAVRVPVANPCAIHGTQPSVVHAACIRGERMLNGEEYFDSFPDEKPAPLERGEDQSNATCLTAELQAALEELSKYFEEFLRAAAVSKAAE